MADKGFDLKVLIPTDDGFSISENGLEKSRYYLMYNLSNRSYQLAEKIKVVDFYTQSKFNTKELKQLINDLKIDRIVNINNELFDDCTCKIIVIGKNDIGRSLNLLIDQIDKKELK